MLWRHNLSKNEIQLVVMILLLLQVEDPLMEATKYLKLLQKHSSDSLETHLLSFEVNMRKQKILLALQVCLYTT